MAGWGRCGVSRRCQCLPVGRSRVLEATEDPPRRSSRASLLKEILDPVLMASAVLIMVSSASAVRHASYLQQDQRGETGPRRGHVVGGLSAVPSRSGQWRPRPAGGASWRPDRPRPFRARSRRPTCRRPAMPMSRRPSAVVIRPAGHVFVQALDLDPLRLAALDAGEVDLLDAADERLNLLRVRVALPIGAVPRTAVVVVEVMDGVVVDLLHQPVGTLRHVDPAEDVQERPDDVLPALVWVRIPVPLLDVDRFEAGPEDGHEDRPPVRSVLLGVRACRRSGGESRPCADRSRCRSA